MLKATDRGYQDETNPIILHLSDRNFTNYTFFSLCHFCPDQTQSFATIQKVGQTLTLCKHTKDVMQFLRHK